MVAPHHALGDAITTAQLFLALTARLGRLGYRNARDFVDLTSGRALTAVDRKRQEVVIAITVHSV